jgi:PAS domain S-box-containing protein
VGSTSFCDEVFAPLQKIRSFLILGLGLALVLIVLSAYLISRTVTRPLEKLIQPLEDGRRGNFSIRMAYDSPDELGKLSSHFNAFMEYLEDYHHKLTNEIKKNIQTQAALEENELKLRELFNQSFQYTGILSPRGILKEVNKSALDSAGCVEADVLEKPFWRTIWWQDEQSREQLKQAVHTACTGELVRLEVLLTGRRGTTRYVDISLKPIFNKSCHIEFIIAEGRDITDLKTAETERRHMAVQLEKSQRMEAIGTLAGGIAHDFNNILASILGYTQMAQMSITYPDKARHHIDQITKGARRATDLVQQGLTFSRQTEYQKHPLKIYLVVKEALKLLRSSIPSTIEINLKIHAKSMVMADPTQIHQVIMNLCTNAYHAMAKNGGMLTVGLTKVESTALAEEPVSLPQTGEPYLKLEVSDTGCGMDERTLKKAFDPYFTTKKIGRGTGFGLALVQAIVDEHDGAIHVVSHPGKGSRFFIYLPITGHTTPSPQENTAPYTPTPGHGTIMVVDDEADLRLLMAELLGEYGYRVFTFENGETALTAFKKNPDRFDLVITDMTMPKMTGDIFAKALIAIRKQIPIILCTGYSENISEQDALAIGIKNFLQKPVQNLEILAIIQKLLKT